MARQPLLRRLWSSGCRHPLARGRILERLAVGWRRCWRRLRLLSARVGVFCAVRGVCAQQPALRGDAPRPPPLRRSPHRRPRRRRRLRRRPRPLQPAHRRLLRRAVCALGAACRPHCAAPPGAAPPARRGWPGRSQPVPLPRGARRRVRGVGLVGRDIDGSRLPHPRSPARVRHVSARKHARRREHVRGGEHPHTTSHHSTGRVHLPRHGLRAGAQPSSLRPSHCALPRPTARTSRLWCRSFLAQAAAG
mmetsp:Transcript_44261/g.146684  ORF Transcript_44261/g.146684 Transcript_44261/m.146684 type:complete len:249 (-) Transcript_44261:215-961(-)